MERKRRRALVVAVVVTVLLAIMAWLVVVVIVPVVEDAECAGIEFRAPAQAQAAPVEPRDRPPVGGTGGLAGELRRALRGDVPVVYCDDFADPFVLRVGDSYYAYSTNTEDYHVPLLTAGGLLHARKRSESLPQLPSWSLPGRVWAPAVLPRPGGFVLYYATAAPNPDRQCLSRTFSARPDEFVDRSTGPLVCPERGGAIDPSPFVDRDGRAYLLWKHYAPGTTGIVAQELSPDGLNLVGPMRLLLEADQAWEGGLVEAPSMVAHEGRYYLFYSANDWATPSYAIGYAVCDSPMGPCTKSAGPWLASTEKAEGPGGQEAFADKQGRLGLVLHAWVRGKVGYPNGARNVFVLRLDFLDGVPVAA
jgi:beta-xylosidase